MKKVNIVMFHYIRPIAGSQYPNIKGLELASFKNQLDYFQKKFNIIKAEDLIAASKNLMELHKDFIPIVPFLLYACIFMQDFYSQVLQLSSSPADNFFHRAESRRFFFVWNYKKTVRSSSLWFCIFCIH